MFVSLCISLIESSKTDYHDWYLLVIVGAGLVSVALTMLSEIIDKAKIVYFKIRNFRKSQDIPMGKSSP